MTFNGFTDLFHLSQQDYFHRAVRDGKHLNSYHVLADIYKAENNLPKAIEMLENTAQ